MTVPEGLSHSGNPEPSFVCRGQSRIEVFGKALSPRRRGRSFPEADSDIMKTALMRPSVRVFLVLAMLSCAVLRAQNVTSTTEMERQVFEWTNQERAKISAPPLKWSDRLAVAARLHSDEMAQHKDLSHQVQGEPVFTERLAERGARFSAAAENVGYGDEAEDLQSGWMHSPPHRANLLNPAYTEMGVGIVRSGDRLWATEDFATALQGSSDEFEQALVREISTRRTARKLAPLKATVSPALRQAACSGETSPKAAYAALPNRNMHAYAFNFTTPKADELPQVLVNRVLELPGGGYSLGACFSPGSGGMATYRALVLLYQ